MRGLTINIHYASGHHDGPRIAESRTSPLRAFASRWVDLQGLLAAGLPPTHGVYLLVGPHKNGSACLAVRPGEASDVRRRLMEHAADPTKSSFEEVYVMCSVDGRFTKLDVRYLEARLHELVEASSAAILEVERVPPVFAPALAEVATLETWLEQSRILWHAEGCRAIDAGSLPLAANAAEADDGAIAFDSTKMSESLDEFELTYDGIWARGAAHPSGFLVRAGSDIRRRENAALLTPIADRRRWLQRQSVLGELPGVRDRWRLMADVLLPSALIAAKTITGAHVTDRSIWRRLSGSSRLLVAR